MPDLLLVTSNYRRLLIRRASNWQRYWAHKIRRWAKGASEAAKAARGLTHRSVKAGRQAASVARWSAVRARAVQTGALLKLSANSWMRRDQFALSPLENHLVREAAGMDCSIWISPQLLHDSVRQITPANVVTFAELAQLVRPVSGEPTIKFIDEIVRQRRPYKDTTLFREIESGKSRRKHVGNETVTLTTANFREYYEKCLRHVEFVASHGLRPWEKSTALSYDGDIAALLSAHGELMFLRRGTHRLGIARALGLQRIPVQIFMVTGRYLADTADEPGWYLPWRLSAAIRRACTRTLPDLPDLPVNPMLDIDTSEFRSTRPSRASASPHPSRRHGYHQ
jgi:hypothetical protein